MPSSGRDDSGDAESDRPRKARSRARSKATGANTEKKGDREKEKRSKSEKREKSQKPEKVRKREMSEKRESKSASPPAKKSWRNMIRWDSPSRSPSRSPSPKKSPVRKKSPSRKRSNSRGRRRRRKDKDSRSSSSGARDRRVRRKESKSRSRSRERAPKADRSRSRDRVRSDALVPFAPKRASKWDTQEPGPPPALPPPRPMPAMMPRPNMLPNMPFTRMVRVPPVMIGRIVGKNGSTIHQFKRLSGCEIGMEKDAQGSYAFIQGPSAEHAANAEAMINERLLADAQKLPDEDKFRLLGTASASAQSLADVALRSTSRQFNIGPEHVSRILGVGGDTVFNIQKTAGCTVKVEATGQITLSRGTPQQMDHATSMINAVVEESKQLMMKGAGKGMAPLGKGVAISYKPEKLEFPSNQMPWVGSQIL